MVGYSSSAGARFDSYDRKTLMFQPCCRLRNSFWGNNGFIMMVTHNNSASTSLLINPTMAIFLSQYAATADAFKRGPRWFQKNQSVGHLLMKKLTSTRSQYPLKKSKVTSFADAQLKKLAEEITSHRIMRHRLLVCPGRSPTSYRRFRYFVWAFRGGKIQMKFNAHTPADFRSLKNS